MDKEEKETDYYTVVVHIVVDAYSVADAIYETERALDSMGEVVSYDVLHVLTEEGIIDEDD